jgi:mannan endo-1,4-beta-mannosidase
MDKATALKYALITLVVVFLGALVVFFFVKQGANEGVLPTPIPSQQMAPQDQEAPREPGSQSGLGLPSDKNATKETVALFQNLRDLRGKGLIFGQQKASYSGQKWTDKTAEKDMSDVETAVGDAPGLYGINLNTTYEVGQGMDHLKPHVLVAYNRGAVVTVHMPMPNPVTLGDSHDFKGDPMVNLMPGKSGNENFRKMLDDIADFAHSLEVDGVKIPVIFRPWHEMTGSWDWWGQKHSTPEQYIAAWRYMVDYLRNEKGVHNMLFAFAPSQVTDHPQGGFDRYPGDAYVDVVGVDRYDTDETEKGKRVGDDYTKAILADARFLVNFAEEHGKVAAITESGVKQGFGNTTAQDWFMKDFLEPLKADPVARKIVYFMTWTNDQGGEGYRVPLQGQSNYESFVRFYQDPYTLFARDLPNMYQ